MSADHRHRTFCPAAMLLVLGSVGCGSSNPLTEPHTEPPDESVAPRCLPGDLLVSSRFSDNVLRYNVADGAFVGVFAAGGGLDNPNGIGFGADGHMYAAMGDAGSVLRFDGRSGAFIDEFVSPGSGGLMSSRDLAFHPNGNLLVASGGSDEVLEFDGTDGQFLRVAGSHRDLDGPVGIAVGPDDVLYVSSAISGGVFLFDANDGTFLRRIALIDNPTDVLVDADGSLLVASGVLNEVRRYDPVGRDLLGTVAAGNGLNVAIGLALAADGSLLVASFSSDEVKRFDPATGGFLGDLVTAGRGGLDGTHFFAFAPLDVQPEGGICG